MGDHIEKRVELKAPVSRVWRALTDYREFGEWFRVSIDGPFAPGRSVRGHILYPGYEHLTWEATVETIEPERLFSFRWHPYAVDPNVNYSGEPTTLVEFRLEASGGGTILTVTESGFGAIPPHRRAEALRMNDSGWSIQVENIARHVGTEGELAGRAVVFAALGDETRLVLIGRLSTGPAQSIARLAAGAVMTRQGVSKHLRVLENAGIVRSVRAGREARFELRPEPLAAARSYLEEVSVQWDEALARLKAFVER